MKHWGLFIIMIGCLLSGCGQGPSLSEGGFDSPDPAARLYAIQRAGQTKDRSAVKPLIERLDSDDAAERLLAINALEQITGTRNGYDPYGTAQQRVPAIDAWTQYIKSADFIERTKP